jgi:type I restriction enzyme S subunit
MKNGWQWKPLGEVCKTGSGGTPLKEKKEYYEGGTIPWLMSGEVSQGEVREATRFITQKGLENSAARIFPKDTVLVAMYGATAGQVGILRFEAATNQAVCGILPNKQFVPEFLFYFLLSKKDELVAQATGNAQPNISQIKIKNTDVPILPLSEQRRIVGILDEAFDGIATATANAEKNLQNARAIFESHLQSVFTQREGGWPTKQLGDVCDFEGGSQPPKSQFIYTPMHGYVRFLQIRDFGSDKYVTFISASKKNRLCVEDDIMIGRYGASVGKILTGKAGAYNVALMKTIPDPVHLDRSFFYHYLISGAFQGRLVNVAARSAQNGFSKEDIYGFPIPVPPPKEQQKVVEQIGPLSDETQRLVSLYERKLVALDALKKSLLHQAFSGAL